MAKAWKKSGGPIVIEKRLGLLVVNMLRGKSVNDFFNDCQNMAKMKRTMLSLILLPEHPLWRMP
jgi:hypothetical protein